MNRKKSLIKYLLISSIILAVIVCSVSLTVTALSKRANNDINSSENLIEQDVTQFAKQLQKKKLNELIADVNSLDFSADEEEIVCYYEVIKTKLHNAPKGDVTKELLDNDNSDDVKVNLLILCDSENIDVDYEKLLPILSDVNASASVKNVLIDLMAGEGNEYVDEIEEQALAYNESTFMNALTNLQFFRPEKAAEITNNVLSDLKNEFSPIYKGALVAKSIALYLNSEQEERNSFIEICDDILKNMNAEDKEEKEISVIYSLSSVKSRETFFYLMSLESEKAKSFRAYIVEENQEIIDDILSEAPSAESIELLAKTSSYYVPQADYQDMIKIYIEKNDSYLETNQAQKNILLEVIK